MAIKVKAVERNVAFEKGAEKWAYVLQADLYNKLSQAKGKRSVKAVLSA